MCLLCGENMKTVRGLLAGKVIGLLSEEDDTDLEPTVDSVLYDHASKIATINSQAAADMVACTAIRERMNTGIRKVLPTMTIEDRFRMALAAGAVKL